MTTLKSRITRYERDAAILSRRYESLSFEDVHEAILNILPQRGGRVLDVGAGSGRDANALSRYGLHVVAAEPSSAMLRRARSLHPHARVIWLQDALPYLCHVRRLGISFDLILANAIWMHVPLSARLTSLRTLAHLMKSHAKLVLTLRHSRWTASRGFFSASVAELDFLAVQARLRVVRKSLAQDQLRRTGVAWTMVVLVKDSDRERSAKARLY